MPAVLLAEPSAVLRQTVAMTARGTGMADVHEVSSLIAAREQLMLRDFDGLLLRLDEETPAIDLIGGIRAGRTFTRSDSRIAVMTARCSGPLARELHVLGVEHVLLHPLRARKLILTIESLVGGARAVR